MRAGNPGSCTRPAARGFSLLEILLAMFILAIGLIMVATVFPVGANWTRQATEESVASNVALAAKGVLDSHYGPNGRLRNALAPDYLQFNNPGFSLNPLNVNSILKAHNNLGTFTVTPFTLQALPQMDQIPVWERAYQLGANNPFPAKDPDRCTYFWTALARLNPAHWNPAGAPGDETNGIIPSASYKYDVYILVFRKGSVEHRFTNQPPAVIGAVAMIPSIQPVAYTYMPSVVYTAYNPGQYDANRTPSVYNAVPPMGQCGIGALSGTVFRQNLNPVTYQGAVPRPLLRGQSLNSTGAIVQDGANAEPIIYAPAADFTSQGASPLIHIYQTTMTF